MGNRGGKPSGVAFAAAATLAFAGAAVLWAQAPRSARKRAKLNVPGVPDVYYAHRGLHDAGSGLTKRYANMNGAYIELARRMAEQAGFGNAQSEFCIAPENTLAAFAAACEAGYGIELDVQLTADGQLVVVHDSDLLRVARDARRVEDLTFDELHAIELYAGCKPGAASAASAAGDEVLDELFDGTFPRKRVPLFSDVLVLVAGRVPLIIEFKFPNNARWGARERELMRKGAALLDAYDGPYAVESFHPGAMAWYRRHRPQVCRGQLAEWPGKGKGSALGFAAGLLLADAASRPDFVAYHWKRGAWPQVRASRLLGAEAVSWTPRSLEEFEYSQRFFARHIFEGFVPPVDL